MVLVVILTLYGSFLLIGWLASKRARVGTSADLLLAGRSMPLWLATMTMTATWVDGGYLLGTAEGTYRSSLSSGIQGGLCFGLSLILGGLFFAGRMRRLGFTTLIDPFEVRFGKGWAVVLFLPAILAEIFWSAELLVALGATFAGWLDYPVATVILVSALVVLAYTMMGGMWSVAYTDALQLGLVMIGLLVALPFVFGAVGGIGLAWEGYLTARPERGGFFPPLTPSGSYWTLPAVVGWWDVSLMLILGGIPWNCYFQRVLACRTATLARWHSVIAGGMTIGLTLPPLLMGVAVFQHAWPSEVRERLTAQAAETLPLAFQQLTPTFVMLLGLGGIIAAVTSSFSSSILSAASMISWNGVARLFRSGLSTVQLRLVLRLAVVGMGAVAVLLALRVQSVQALWFLTSDLVFVLLFPQLLWALFDPQANRVGSIVAFVFSLLLRLGGGEPLFGWTPLISYPVYLEMMVPGVLPGGVASWVDPQTGALLFPFKTMAAGAGLLLLPVVSRLTARWDPPRPLQSLAVDRRGGEPPPLTGES
jgi:high affinity choline transporter 7